MKKWVYILVLIILCSWVVAEDYNFGLTYSIADLRYCKQGGSCNLTNVSIKTINNLNITGNLNMTSHNITDVNSIFVSNVYGNSPITFHNNVQTLNNFTANWYFGNFDGNFSGNFSGSFNGNINNYYNKTEVDSFISTNKSDTISILQNNINTNISKEVIDRNNNITAANQSITTTLFNKYVPYTGATGNVNIGGNTFTASGITSTGFLTGDGIRTPRGTTISIGGTTNSPNFQSCNLFGEDNPFYMTINCQNTLLALFMQNLTTFYKAVNVTQNITSYLYCNASTPSQQCKDLSSWGNEFDRTNVAFTNKTNIFNRSQIINGNITANGTTYNFYTGGSSGLKIQDFSPSLSYPKLSTTNPGSTFLAISNVLYVINDGFPFGSCVVLADVTGAGLGWMCSDGASPIHFYDFAGYGYQFDNTPIYLGANSESSIINDGIDVILTPDLLNMGGQFKVKGNTKFDGNVNITGNLSVKRPYLVATDNFTQNFLNIANAQVMTFHWVEDNYLINIEGKENITFQQSGDYHFTIMPLFQSTSGVPSIEFWYEQYNGTAWIQPPRTNTQIRLASANNPLAFTIVYQNDLTPIEKIRFMWWASSTNAQLVRFANSSAPSRPESPSIILNIQKVSEIAGTDIPVYTP